jgi:hypothetical protein
VGIESELLKVKYLLLFSARWFSRHQGWTLEKLKLTVFCLVDRVDDVRGYGSFVLEKFYLPPDCA